MECTYRRDESGFITSTDPADWTARVYLDAHTHLEPTATEPLPDWPDVVVDWHSIGDGAGCGTERALSLAVTEQSRLVEHVGRLRKRARLSLAQTARHWDLSVFALTEMVQRLAVANTEAEATTASTVDAKHAALLADSDTGADQDWQGERTVWTFADGSTLILQDSEIENSLHAI
ncbi:hypothetical protein [uncultured Halovibrio sp.]|uniref:hypothetical protein n=1 Tax=uncultured Halovibrio sp. TaxID=985049 RepID=UPI0025DE9392|nr:hypothetical protein [uncultured Halovibrio sp.]